MGACRHSQAEISGLGTSAALSPVTGPEWMVKSSGDMNCRCPMGKRREVQRAQRQDAGRGIKREIGVEPTGQITAEGKRLRVLLDSLTWETG